MREAHGAWADACNTKSEAHLSARGWRSPLPPHREKGTATLEASEHEATVAQGEGKVGQVGAEEIKPSPENIEIQRA